MDIRIILILILAVLLVVVLLIWWTRKPRALFYIIALTIPYEIGFYVPQLLGITFTPQLILIIGILYIIIIKIISSNRISKIPLFGWWCLYVILSIIAFSKNPAIINPIQGSWVVFRLAIVPALIYPALWLFFHKDSQIRIFFKILAISTAISGIIAVIQFISRGELLSGWITNYRFLGTLWSFPPEVIIKDKQVFNAFYYYSSFFRAHGTFYSPNGFGELLCIVLPITWGLFRGSYGRTRIILGLAVAAQISGLLVTFSRSSWIATVVSLGMLVASEIFIIKTQSSLKSRLALLSMVILAGIGFIIIAVKMKPISLRAISLLNPSQVDELLWRADRWRTAIDQIKQNPWIGSGTTTIFAFESEAGNTLLGSHNLYIDIAYKLGIIPLGIFLIFVIHSLLSGWRWFRMSNEYSDKLFALGIFSACLAYLIAGISGGLMATDNLAILIWALTATAIKSRRFVSQAYE